MRPRRSASVSKLVRSSRIGVFVVLGPGLDLAERLACSLCCQQYRLSSLGSSTRSLEGFGRVGGGGGASAATIGRLHGRPPDVIPLHVVDGFLESDLLMSDSGVLAKKGIANRVYQFGTGGYVDAPPRAFYRHHERRGREL